MNFLTNQQIRGININTKYNGRTDKLGETDIVTKDIRTNGQIRRNRHSYQKHTDERTNEEV